MSKRSAKYAIECFENPKVYNPYVFHRPNVFRWKGSVIPKVLPQTIIVTVLASIVTYLYKETPIHLGMKPSFITVLGLVVSLLLAYRTNTAYDRYWEGLRTWSNMVSAIRNMTRCIWVNVNAEDYEKTSNKVIDDRTKTEHLVEKKTVINLLLGFAIATKHYLREEPKTFEDLKPLISNADHNSPGVQVLVGSNDNYFSGTSNNNNNNNNDNNNNNNFTGKFMKNIKKLLPDSHKKVCNNLPYEITLYLSSYIRKQHLLHTTDDSTISILYSNLSSLTDCLTTFERILRSPIPLAYAIHLTQVTWIYCLSLPFQLVQDLDWITIPVTFIITLTLFGVEKIASEIENPFGWDENDLDLDDFCGILNRELCNVTSETIPPVNDWIFTKENIPFGSGNVTALQARKLHLDEVKDLLSNESIERNVENVENRNVPNNNDDTIIKVEE
ncbi:Bestrophin, RFP-TM, chloride channel-domain-containing protein [Glomus cerebriforme]|uniref:Bestrophin, RFP-TM, chloride channel-domain-containing protein n=1 Tax=Glomus cerebriforme TaxID=658196 RepID=A0A397SU84_9GLOM|nr:Bestrophin, RFP-TM, chloride channel-domain-containing protein [Glomus cerebriforme]